MVLLNGTKLISLPRDSHRSMILITETFAPLAKMISIYTLLALVVVCQCLLYQMDAKNVFLNSDLSEVVYMQPPLGVPILSRHVC